MLGCLHETRGRAQLTPQECPSMGLSTRCPEISVDGFFQVTPHFTDTTAVGGQAWLQLLDTHHAVHMPLTMP